MTPAFRYALLWIVASLALVVAALTMIAGSFLDGQYVPSNPDAFYHARRILDVVMTGAPVAQFDALIQVPEGSWITWPWGFDTALAALVGLLGPFAREADAARVLMHVPVAFAPVAVALVVVLARQLALSLAASVLMTLAFVALPLVFLAFAVGNVDHHFAELLWTVLSLSSGIAFVRSTTGLKPAVVAGLVLGTAVAVHNGLFILQLPLLAAFALRWWRREALPQRRAVVAFAITLVAVTLVASVPSEPWRRGAFEFYSLSWFHSYAAACSAVLLVVLASVTARARVLVAVALGALVAAVPLLGGVGLGTRFMTGELAYLRDVTEARSPYELYLLFGPAQSTQLFSWLMWLAGPAVIANLYFVARAREPGRQFFSAAAVFYLVLMQLQYRFGVLGVVPLLATLALALDAARERWQPRAAWVAGLGALLVALALTPTRGAWTTPRATGGDPFYADMAPGLARLRDACAERPGVVLAAINDGHWIRYHTPCAVIGNVFLLTEQDARKRLEVEALLASPPDRLLRERPDVAYVLVHSELELFVPVRADGTHGQGVLRWKSATLPALTRALLAPEEELPAGYRALWTSFTAEGGVFARLVAIER